MTAFVYILSHKEKPRFKIGKAVNIAARVFSLTADEFDFAKSRALQVEGEEAANNLERALHRCFGKWRLSPDDMLQQESTRFDGYTEWFRLECFDRLMSFIDQNEELFDYKILGPVQVQALVEKPAKLLRIAKPTSTISRRRVITPEEILGARQLVKQLLPMLLSLLAHSEKAEIEDIGPGARKLSGVCKATHAEVVNDLLFNLLDKGRYRHSRSWFGIFNGTGTRQENDGDLWFSTSYIWPDGGDRDCPVYRAAAQELAELPIPIAGWEAGLRGSRLEDIRPEVDHFFS